MKDRCYNIITLGSVWNMHLCDGNTLILAGIMFKIYVKCMIGLSKTAILCEKELSILKKVVILFYIWYGM